MACSGLAWLFIARSGLEWLFVARSGLGSLLVPLMMSLYAFFTLLLFLLFPCIVSIDLLTFSVVLALCFRTICV